MKCYLFIIFWFCLLSVFSCSPDTEKKLETKTEQPTIAKTDEEHFTTGQIIDKVICKDDTALSYALYLPSTYSRDKFYPVMLVFDPHGTGKLPVSNYKEVAEKYNYIVAGSNNSKNGIAWPEIQKIANLLLTDVRGRFHVNTQRIYALGFSGGARIANTWAMSNGAITGVICCGAASPAVAPTNSRNDFSFMGIAGTEDFNYTEIKKYDKEVLGNHQQHGVLVFNGKHEWPPVASMDEAFLWMELNEKRKNTTQNDSLVSENILLATKEVQALLNKKQLMNAYEHCRKTILFYEGLGDLSFFKDTYQHLQTNKEVETALQKEEQTWVQEESIKKNYIEAVQNNDPNWWKKDIAELNLKIKNAPKNEALVYKRVLSFLSLMMYMQTTSFMKQKNTAAADYFSKLYLVVDPGNFEAHYLAAEVNAIQGNHKEAIQFLNSAVKNGYKDKKRLESDPAFVQINTRTEFQKVIQGLN